LTALGTALVSTAAQAAEVSVSGAANLMFNGSDKADTGNGWSSSDTMTFSASGDLDNGWTVSFSSGIVGSSGTANSASITINTNGMGSINYEHNDSAMPIESTDDMTPSANEESWSHNAASAPAIGVNATTGAFLYTNSDLLDGLTVQAGYVPSATTYEVRSSSEYHLKYTGIEGLTVGYAWGSDDGASVSNSVDLSNVYATYAAGPLTVGIQANEYDSNQANSDEDFSAIGVSYAVSEDLSVSFNQSTIDWQVSTKSDQEAQAIGVSWTSGGVTIGASHHTIDNVGGTAATDVTAYDIAFSFAY